MDKTKEEIIFELLLSINKGGGGALSLNVDVAISQYNKLVEKGVIKPVNNNENKL